ncbi:MAG: SDR family oxidoreductase [Nitrosarchaeum sp.]
MSVFITGGAGALGTELKKKYPNALAPTHQELDLGNREEVLRFFKNHPDIDVIIHAAALTGIRPCEENQPLAWKTNVEGTRNLVDAVLESKQKIQFIYVSTACVFDGHHEMYKESSIPYPENFYALTKLVGESEVRKLPEFLIVRTNFVAKVKFPYPKAFTDRYGTYLFADGVAQGIQDVQKEKLTGIVHIVGDKKMSIYELAKITTPEVQPMTIKEYSGPKLTMDMSLDTERWKKYKITEN